MSESVTDIGGNILLLHHACMNRIVNVMIYIRYPVGKAHYPALKGCRFLAVGVSVDPVPDLPGEVQSLALFFNNVHHSHALLIVAEASVANAVERTLARMTERRVSEIVSEGNRLRQGFVKP